MGIYKTLLRHLEIYWVNELHQDMGLSFWSPFKRLNWCRVNKQTDGRNPSPFPFLLFAAAFSSAPFLSLGTKPQGFKAAQQQGSLEGINARINFLSIHDRLFQGERRRPGEGKSSMSAITNPHQPPGCKRLQSFMITYGRAKENKQCCGIPAWEAQILHHLQAS